MKRANWAKIATVAVVVILITALAYEVGYGLGSNDGYWNGDSAGYRVGLQEMLIPAGASFSLSPGAVYSIPLNAINSGEPRVSQVFFMGDFVVSANDGMTIVVDIIQGNSTLFGTGYGRNVSILSMVMIPLGSTENHLVIRANPSNPDDVLVHVSSECRAQILHPVP